MIEVCLQVVSEYTIRISVADVNGQIYTSAFLSVMAAIIKKFVLDDNDTDEKKKLENFTHRRIETIKQYHTCSKDVL